jgi:hypothetical protein
MILPIGCYRNNRVLRDKADIVLARSIPDILEMLLVRANYNDLRNDIWDRHLEKKSDAFKIKFTR